MAEKLNTRKIILSTVITALISGFVGIIIANYNNRAKPAISLTSVGFKAPLKGESIELPDDLISTTSNSSWAPSLKRFENFEKLVNVEKEVSTHIIKLNQAISSIKAWKKQYGISESTNANGIQVINKTILLESPIISDDIVGITLFLMLRSNDVNRPPLSLNEIKEVKSIFDIVNDEGTQRLIILLENRNLQFQYSRLPDSRKNDIKTFVNSISKGVKTNIDHYTEEFENEANRQLIEAQKIREKIRTILLPNSSISTKISINNLGKTAISLKPYFGLKIFHQDYKNKAFVMTAENKKKKRNPFKLTKDGFTIGHSEEELKGKDVKVERYLPEPQDSYYLNIPPGGSIELTLVGIEPLRELASDINKIHLTKLLKVQVLGISTDGKKIWSNQVTFSETIPEEEKNGLINLIIK